MCNQTEGYREAAEDRDRTSPPRPDLALWEERATQVLGPQGYPQSTTERDLARQYLALLTYCLALERLVEQADRGDPCPHVRHASLAQWDCATCVAARLHGLAPALPPPVRVRPRMEG